MKFVFWDYFYGQNRNLMQSRTEIQVLLPTASYSLCKNVTFIHSKSVLDLDKNIQAHGTKFSRR